MLVTKESSLHILPLKEQECEVQDFLGGPMVKNLPCNAGNMSLSPGQGTRTSHASGQLNSHATTEESTCHMEKFRMMQ